MLGAIIIGALVADAIFDTGCDERIFKSLEEDSWRLRSTSSYVEEIRNGYAYRVYGDGHREKERI